MSSEYDDLVKVVLATGHKQLETSRGEYLNLPLAMQVIHKETGQGYTLAALTVIEEAWHAEFGQLFAGGERHDVDAADGFCFTCGKYHGGGEPSSKPTLPKKVRRGRRIAPKTATEKALNDMAGVRQQRAYESLSGVSHRDLRIDIKLWRLNDTNPE